MNPQAFEALFACIVIFQLIFVRLTSRQMRDIQDLEQRFIIKKYECAVFALSSMVQGFLLYYQKKPIPLAMGGFFLLSLICFIHGLYELIKESKQARQEKSNRV